MSSRSRMRVLWPSTSRLLHEEEKKRFLLICFSSLPSWKHFLFQQRNPGIRKFLSCVAFLFSYEYPRVRAILPFFFLILSNLTMTKRGVFLDREKYGLHSKQFTGVPCLLFIVISTAACFYAWLWCKNESRICSPLLFCFPYCFLPLCEPSCQRLQYTPSSFFPSYIHLRSFAFFLLLQQHSFRRPTRWKESNATQLAFCFAFEATSRIGNKTAFPYTCDLETMYTM